MALMDKCPFCMGTVPANTPVCEHCNLGIATGTCYACKKLNAPGAQVCAFCGGKYLVGVEPGFVPIVKEKPAPVVQRGIHANRPPEFPELAPALREELTAKLAEQAPQPEESEAEETSCETEESEDEAQETPAETAAEEPVTPPPAEAPPPAKAVLPKIYEKISEELDPENGLPLEVRCLNDYSEMTMIRAGAFVMGSPDEEGNPDEHPRREIWLEAYYMDRRQVTAGQFRKFCTLMRRDMPAQPPWSTDKHPVVNVSWYEAAAYCEWAGKFLPTEAQWEKAARAGSDTKFSTGAGEKGLGDYAWYSANSNQRAHPAGEKKPNKFGFYDLPGNALEWCQDGYDETFYEHGTDKDPRGTESAIVLVCRGGAWNLDASNLRCARRGCRQPNDRTDNLGFRCVSATLNPLNAPSAEPPAQDAESEEETGCEGSEE